MREESLRPPVSTEDGATSEAGPGVLVRSSDEVSLVDIS